MTNAWQAPLHQQASEHIVSVADVYGASWWKSLESAVDSINCEPCREHAQELLSGMHDLVNVSLGKALYNPENFARVAQQYQEAAMGQRLPKCSPAKAEKVEECIHQLKGDESVNPWAVCAASVGCSPWSRSIEIEEINLGGEIVLTVEDPDMEEDIEDLLVVEGVA